MNNKREWLCGHCGKWWDGRTIRCTHLIPQAQGYPKKHTVYKANAAATRVVPGRRPSVPPPPRDTTRPPYVVGRPYMRGHGNRPELKDKLHAPE